jgi:prophage antirepressor-like protein
MREVFVQVSMRRQVLDIRNSRDIASSLDDDERNGGIADTPGGPQEFNIVNEMGAVQARGPP